MFHWPDDIKEHGPLCAINAEGLEASNGEAKCDFRTRCNKQKRLVDALPLLWQNLLSGHYLTSEMGV
jgi:hypothetical protein